MASIAAYQSNTIYDGNVIQLHDLSLDYMILQEGAETNNQEFIEPILPFDENAKGKES